MVALRDENVEDSLAADCVIVANGLGLDIEAKALIEFVVEETRSNRGRDQNSHPNVLFGLAHWELRVGLRSSNIACDPITLFRGFNVSRMPTHG